MAAIATGIIVNRPRQRLPWWLVAAGTATFVAGDTTYDLLAGPLGLENPFPSVADVLYLCTYPLFAGGLLLVVRARSRDRDRQALLDALIVTTGLGTRGLDVLGGTVRPGRNDDCDREGLLDRVPAW